jgi:hypothetical protein
MAVDEFYYHRSRGLGFWERWGHPLDTLSVLACFLVASFAPLELSTIGLYLLIALGSCVLVTKDEWVHTKECTAGEQWLHALLFVWHPVVLLSGLLLWVDRADVVAPQDPAAASVLGDLWSHLSIGSLPAQLVLYGQSVAIGLFLLYQINTYILLKRCRRPEKKKEPVSQETAPSEGSASGLT